MAGRVIAQIIVSGTTMLTKAFFSAYQQALRSENNFFCYSKSFIKCPFSFIDAKVGGAPITNAATGAVSKFKMRPDEALRIMNIEKTALTKQLLDEV